MKKGLVLDFPEINTELYFYNPYNLSSPVGAYSIEKYKNLDYYNKRIKSKLCYYDLESVIARIEYERNK